MTMTMTATDLSSDGGSVAVARLDDRRRLRGRSAACARGEL